MVRPVVAAATVATVVVAVAVVPVIVTSVADLDLHDLARRRVDLDLVVADESAGLFGGSTHTMTQDEVARALAVATASSGPGTASPPPSTGTSAPPSATTDPTGPAGSDPAVVSSAGGLVIARCTGALVEVISWTPAQGYRTKEVERGPAHDVKVEFESDDGDVRVQLRCVDGVPSAEVDDDGGQD